MKKLIKSFDKLSTLAKVILALPALDICWAIYRICRSANKGNVLGVVLGIIMIPLCACLFWILDIITILTSDKVLWID